MLGYAIIGLIVIVIGAVLAVVGIRIWLQLKP
jgi:hypothetical protein